MSWWDRSIDAVRTHFSLNAGPGGRPSGTYAETTETSHEAWRDVPRLQRTLAEPITPVAINDRFRDSLAAFTDPSFLSPLSHQVDPSGGGLVAGLVSPGQPQTRGGPGLVVSQGAARPTPGVQRLATWSTASTEPELLTVPLEYPHEAASVTSEVALPAHEPLVTGSASAPPSATSDPPVAAAMAPTVGAVHLRQPTCPLWSSDPPLPTSERQHSTHCLPPSHAPPLANQPAIPPRPFKRPRCRQPGQRRSRPRETETRSNRRSPSSRWSPLNLPQTERPPSNCPVRPHRLRAHRRGRPSRRGRNPCSGRPTVREPTHQPSVRGRSPQHWPPRQQRWVSWSALLTIRPCSASRTSPATQGHCRVLRPVRARETWRKVSTDQLTLVPRPVSRQSSRCENCNPSSFQSRPRPPRGDPPAQWRPRLNPVWSARRATPSLNRTPP